MFEFFDKTPFIIWISYGFIVILVIALLAFLLFAYRVSVGMYKERVFHEIVSDYWGWFRVRLPFRMALGKFGICLVRLGRFLQIRYANWNHEFRLKFEEHNTDLGEFYVSEPVTTERILTFSSPMAQPGMQSLLVPTLFAIKGVAMIHLTPYCVKIVKGRVFSWDELRPEIERVILKELTRKSEKAA